MWPALLLVCEGRAHVSNGDGGMAAACACKMLTTAHYNIISSFWFSQNGKGIAILLLLLLLLFAVWLPTNAISTKMHTHHRTDHGCAQCGGMRARIAQL